MVLAFAFSRRYNTHPVVNVSTQSRTGRAWIEVNLANLVANAQTVRAAAKGAALLPMVKADGYGLGAVEVARALEDLDPWGFGVATPEEGVVLREAGIRRPVLVFTPASPETQDLFLRHDLRAVLDDPAVIDRWHLPFHLEIDTGMGRCGIRYDDECLENIDSRMLEGVFTHFYAADDSPGTVTEQWARFESAIDSLPRRPEVVHAANSAGAWRLDASVDIVRPGIFLYGGRCGEDLPAPAPVATLHARVVSVRSLPQGATVSYGGDWTATRDTIVATLGIGYADGVRRSLQGRAQVLLQNVRYPVVGRVTMDFIMVDIGPEGKAKVGDNATLIGGTEETAITLDEFASWSSTISYEVLTGLGSRVVREYLPL
ncbi:MAG: alanine racemase [Gemmatimonadales bacterium]